MKKICHLTSVHVPFDTRIFFKECKSLAEADYEVHLIARHERDETIDGIHVHAIPEFNSKIKRLLYSTRAVYRKALEGDYDVYHFHDPELIPAGVLLKKRGKKVIYDVHEDYPVYFIYKEAFPRALRKSLAWLIGKIERYSAGMFDAVVTVTPTIYERFKSLNPNTYLVYNFPSIEGLVPDEELTPWQNKSDAVVYVGSLTLDRGVEEMVRAAGLVQEKIPVSLLLAGDFAGRSDEEYIKSLPEFSFVDYRGHTSRDETSHLLAQAKAGLILCYPQRNYRDAYPTKLFEYMSAGIPVVASDFPLWKRIIESAGCGLTVDPKNPEKIAEAVITLLDNPRESEEMGKKGREAVKKKYNWENEKKVLLNLYKNIF